MPRKFSRRDFLNLLGPGVLSATLLSRCGSATPVSPKIRVPATLPATLPATPTALPPHPSPLPVPSSELVDLRVKIGQMLLVGFRGTTVQEAASVVADIRERHLGGVVLFDYDVPAQSPLRNIQSSAQVKTLLADLQALSEIPLLVAIDQEGGLVARLTPRTGFPETLSHAELGALGDPGATYAAAESMAVTLADLGITLNLAPVVDLCVNPTNPVIAGLQRCFSADSQIAAEHARRFIEAHHAHGVSCALKHFPGHGSSTTDSHLGLADVTSTWTARELEPYAFLIESGLADVVMTAHVFNAELDAQYPATLSEAVLGGLLREQLGYTGVIISDDMQMGAVTQQYAFDEALALALAAGVDMLAFANNSVYEDDIVARAVATIADLVARGVVSEARIDASYRRILRLKGVLAA